MSMVSQTTTIEGNVVYRIHRDDRPTTSLEVLPLQFVSFSGAAAEQDVSRMVEFLARASSERIDDFVRTILRRYPGAQIRI